MKLTLQFKTKSGDQVEIACETLPGAVVDAAALARTFGPVELHASEDGGEPMHLWTFHPAERARRNSKQ